MIDLLRELGTLMARDRLTVDELVARLGRVAEDYGSNLLIETHNPLLGAADLVREVDQRTLAPSTSPAHLELTPAEPPTLGVLEAAFGPALEIPAEDKGQLPQAIFERPIAAGRAYETVLIAAVDDGRVLSLILRRDPRLE